MNKALEEVTVTVDGVELKATKGSMLIEVTDAAGIYIPRFCYHEKLSIAANCRMCLVEVERAPKPLPACATPVMDGMVVQTRSKLAREAQQGTMEFLLINHPLDCPICDQGGECELQDLAMGYGRDVSRYTERKRVVADRDIGPLVQTEMTRCIHCTRCVRFGEEIAGLRELGATGRGEHMEIGTYVAKAMRSELSGNVIDICPVGALTAKPSRYGARSWEFRQKFGVSPHDAIGTNLHLHTRREQVKRVVACQNDAINETWIADRDRFSYAAFEAPDRLLKPRVKDADGWHEVDWDTALDAAAAGLREVISRHGAKRLGVVASGMASTEELTGLAKLARSVGCPNVDHRLRHAPGLPQPRAASVTLPEVEQADTLFIVGAELRAEAPLLNLRVRKAALAGAKVWLTNPVAADCNFPVVEQWQSSPQQLPGQLDALLAAVDASDDTAAFSSLARSLADPDNRRVIVVGMLALSSPQAVAIQHRLEELGRTTGSAIVYLPEAGNSLGAVAAGCYPDGNDGMGSTQMFTADLQGYLLYQVEPELDAFDPDRAGKALNNAEFVVQFGAYHSAAADEYASVQLPIALFAESEGGFINLEGTEQLFDAAVRPPVDAREGWKVIRVLANHLGLGGFDWVDIDSVRAEIPRAEPPQPGTVDADLGDATGLYRVSRVPLYGTDPIVRRAPPLQAMPQAPQATVRLHPDSAAEHGCADADSVRLEHGGGAVEVKLETDDTVAPGCAVTDWTHPVFAKLGPVFGPVTVTPA